MVAWLLSSPSAPEDPGDGWVALPTAALTHCHSFMVARCTALHTRHRVVLVGIALQHRLSPQPLVLMFSPCCKSLGPSPCSVLLR